MRLDQIFLAEKKTAFLLASLLYRLKITVYYRSFFFHNFFSWKQHFQWSAKLEISGFIAHTTHALFHAAPSSRSHARLSFCIWDLKGNTARILGNIWRKKKRELRILWSWGSWESGWAALNWSRHACSDVWWRPVSLGTDSHSQKGIITPTLEKRADFLETHRKRGKKIKSIPDCPSIEISIDR